MQGVEFKGLCLYGLGLRVERLGSWIRARGLLSEFGILSLSFMAYIVYGVQVVQGSAFVGRGQPL